MGADSIMNIDALGPYSPPTDTEVAAICRHVADQPDAAMLLEAMLGEPA